MTPGRVFVCSTCSRYAPPAAGESTRGQEMVRACKQASAAKGGSIAVRSVECLNGCPQPCTAALRTPGKTLVRFSELVPDDAGALIEAAMMHAESPTGDLPIEALPDRLRKKIAGQVDVLVKA